MLRRLGSALALAAVPVLVMTACTASPAPTADVEFAAPDAGIQLFQLPWTSIAEECENTLGPNGFAWVLTSPPQEHIVRDEWWASYQPVSYELESRLGTREEFAEMASRCDEAGVAVIADAVINHMIGQDAAGTGWAGTPYEHYGYPGLYGYDDFHHCGLTGDDDIDDYDSRAQVQTCELVNLADLDTSSTHVRETITAYLEDLLSLGVAGFRIDAAKHMAADDVAAIVASLPPNTRVMSEVIRGGGEPVQPEEYTDFGEVFEFTFARDLGPQVQAGRIYDPDLSDARPSHVPAASAIVFVDNHDTERGEASVTYRDGPLYVIANVLLLADDYGTPILYSGYAFDDRDAGARAELDGTISDAPCGGVTGPAESYDAGERTCLQAWTAIAGMLEWRSAVGDAPRLEGFDALDAYGFEREGRGVVAVNLGEAETTISVPTTLPSGGYCDVVASGPSVGGEGCADAEIDVVDGAATFTLGPQTAAAIHIGSRAG